MSEEEDIDKKIEELRLKKKLQDLERQQAALQPKTRPKTLEEQIAETKKMLDQNQAFMDNIDKTVRRGIVKEEETPATPATDDSVQQYLHGQGITSDGMRMQTEDAQVIPRRIAATEVTKTLGMIVLISTLNIVFAFMIYMFSAIGLRIVSDISIIIVLAIDGFYMMKAQRKKNYLSKKYQIYQPPSIFSRKQQQEQPMQFAPEQQEAPHRQTKQGQGL